MTFRRGAAFTVGSSFCYGAYMIKVRHTLSSIDADTRTAVCSVDGTVPIHSRGRYENGQQKWRCVPSALKADSAVSQIKQPDNEHHGAKPMPKELDGPDYV